MYTIDSTSNENYYIILLNGVELFKVSKKANKLEDLKKQFKIEG